MRQNYSKRRRNSSNATRQIFYYNIAVLHRYRELKGLSVHGVGVAIGMNPDTCSKVFKGRASYKQVWRVRVFLNADWILLHNLSLRTRDEIDRAVLSEKAVRSSGSAVVGVPQTRSVKRGGTYTGLER